MREYILKETNSYKNRDVDHLYYELDQDCIKLLNKIINKTQCTIVLSSAWRVMGLKRVNKNLKQAGLIHTIRYATEKEYKDRGEQINDFIIKYKIKNYAILDDEGFDIVNHVPEERFIKTEFWDGGLKNKHVQEVIKILKKGV